jgi:hypothetical protein
LRIISNFVVENPHLIVFLLGFVPFCGGLAMISAPWASVAGGLILMGVAVFPFLRSRKS